ncbi:MAG: hypothetical protein PHC33_06450 [Candidatus Omnitrophica bacterium]|nr:hypothetical protein [Candidatus Omnitrophota bacterium]
MAALFVRRTRVIIVSVFAGVCLFLPFWAFAQNRPWSNTAPVIVRIIPGDGTVFIAGAKVPVHIIAYDANRDRLQYRFSIGGVIKRSWSSSSTYYWQSSVSDTGTVSIFCEARDRRGGSAQKSAVFTFLNPAPEEVLQKVSDNYYRIRDFKADTLYSSTLNGKSFGDTQNCRYFFMAADKEKIETFSNSSRSVKTEVIITNGSQVYLVDPQNKTKEEVSLMDSEGINAGEIDYMDIYYNQPRFLSNHSVGRVDAETNFNAKLICVEAVPLQEKGLYSKLRLYIDYNKGILAKTCLYTGDALTQTVEVGESRRMPGGEWVPVKISKIPALSSGRLVSTMVYSNIQINPGLNRDEFDPDKQY